MKSVFGIAGVLAASPVFASFEMLLASDTAGDVIRRVDPISGVTLGSFGGGVLVDPTGVSVDQANNRAYVLDNGNRVSRWNYNTGDFAGSFSVGNGATFMTQNSDGSLNVAFGAGNVLRRYSSTGTLLASYTTTTGFSVLQGFVGSDGNMYVQTRTGMSAGLQRFAYSSGAFVANYGWFADRVTRFPTGANYLNAFADGSGGLLVEHDQFFGGPNNSGAIVTNLLVSATGVVHGHDGMAYISGANAGGSSLVLRYDSNTRVVGTPIGGLGTISSLGIVVAPEPGTMAALGLGVAALLRRSRNRS